MVDASFIILKLINFTEEDDIIWELTRNTSTSSTYYTKIDNLLFHYEIGKVPLIETRLHMNNTVFYMKDYSILQKLESKIKQQVKELENV